jgi:hypothetical protein
LKHAGRLQTQHYWYHTYYGRIQVPPDQISIMGGLFEGVMFPYSDLIFKWMKLKGKYMYEREEMKRLIRWIEPGVVKVRKKAGLKIFGQHRLDQIEEVITVADANGGWGSVVSIAPNQK